jgi:hypothetical protein
MTTLMKQLALALPLMTVGTAVMVAQQAPPPPVTAPAPTNAVGPKIQFATNMFDFGRVKAGEPVKYTYVFTNTGNALLVINSVQPQCGCTTAGQWTKQAEPGQGGEIPIQFNTANYNGPVFKQVTVTCNVTNQPMLFLQLKGTVFKPYELIPPLAVLNVPPDSEVASVVVTITNHTEEPLMLSAPQSNNRMFTAELKTNAPGMGYQLTIATVPPLSMGSVQGQITLHTGSTNPPTISVPAVANVQPAVMVIPSYITLAPGPLATAVTNSVSIRNQSTNDLKLSDPAVNVPGVEAQIKEMQPGKYFTALVAFPQGFEVTPGRQVEVSFKTSNPKFPVVKVPVLQMPRPAPPPAALVPPAKPNPTPVVHPPVIKPPPPRPPPLPAGH